VLFLAIGSLKSSVPYVYLLLPTVPDAEGHVCGHRTVPALGANFSATQSGRIQGAAQ